MDSGPSKQEIFTYRHYVVRVLEGTTYRSMGRIKGIKQGQVWLLDIHCQQEGVTPLEL